MTKRKAIFFTFGGNNSDDSAVTNFETVSKSKGVWCDGDKGLWCDGDKGCGMMVTMGVVW